MVSLCNWQTDDGISKYAIESSFVSAKRTFCLHENKQLTLLKACKWVARKKMRGVQILQLLM